MCSRNLICQYICIDDSLPSGRQGVQAPAADGPFRTDALVREGRSVIITVHGEPVAELRPYLKPDRPQTLEERIAELTARGEIIPARMKPSDPAAFRLGTPKPGALQRFLDDR